MSPRTGRPKVDNPKNIRFSIRLDKDIDEKLEAYCKAHKISKGKAIRLGIDLLLAAEKE